LRTEPESRQALALFLAVYAACLLSLLSKLPLWLDEIVDLKGIRDHDLAHMIAWVPANAGGVPLGYLTRFWTLHLLGYSVFSARLPSAVCSLAACAGVFVLARLFNLRQPLLACLIFALVPLQLRYALESRPYSLALALSVWATVAFLDLLQQVSAVRAAYYGLLVLLGLYTQPYSLFVPLAHLCWLVFAKGYPADLHEARQSAQPVRVAGDPMEPGPFFAHSALARGRLLAVSGLAVTVAAFGFLPWYLWTTHVWAQSVAAQHLHYRIQWRIADVISHELTGAGYWGTGLFVAVACFGFAQLPTISTRLFFSLCTLLPVLLAIFADALFGYFFAIRQILFVLVPLSLLAALGLDRAAQQKRKLATAASVVLIGVLVGADIWYFCRSRENWQAASVALQSLVTNGSCILFIPENTADLYEFFIPGLKESACGGDVSTVRSVAVALSPYGPQ
jgi:uncharacterized membrane protein